MLENYQPHPGKRRSRWTIKAWGRSKGVYELQMSLLHNQTDQWSSWCPSDTVWASRQLLGFELTLLNQEHSCRRPSAYWKCDREKGAPFTWQSPPQQKLRATNCRNRRMGWESGEILWKPIFDHTCVKKTHMCARTHMHARTHTHTFPQWLQVHGKKSNLSHKEDRLGELTVG